MGAFHDLITHTKWKSYFNLKLNCVLKWYKHILGHTWYAFKRCCLSVHNSWTFVGTCWNLICCCQGDIIIVLVAKLSEGKRNGIKQFAVYLIQ